MANVLDWFKTGGLNINSTSPTSTLPQGPGYGYYGAQDIYTPTQTTQPTNNVGGGVNNIQSVQTTGEESGPSPEDLFRQQQEASINAGWDSYTNQLNSMLNSDLPGYRTTQEGIATNSANLAKEQAGTQKTTSERDLAAQEKKNLRDLSSNMANLFQAGNIFLGQRGAGDSSAANQYSYALQKQGTRARSDIKSQVAQREGQISDIYNSEVNRIDSELQQRVSQIADWFYTTQQNLKSSLASAGLNREKDLQALNQNLYNQALTYLQNVQAQALSTKASLEQWAVNNATSVNQLKSNLQSLSQIPQFQGLSGTTPTLFNNSSYSLPVGYSASTSDRDAFGNIIR